MVHPSLTLSSRCVSRPAFALVCSRRVSLPISHFLHSLDASGFGSLPMALRVERINLSCAVYNVSVRQREKLVVLGGERKQPLIECLCLQHGYTHLNVVSVAK